MKWGVGKAGVMVYVIQVLAREKQAEPQGLLASQSTLLSRLQASERTVSK